MVNEATKIELANSTGCPRQYTCADAIGIAKGTLLVLAGDRTASSCIVLVGSTPLGIASMDKVASDLSTTITAFTNGIFNFTSSGTIVRGQKVKTTNVANIIQAAEEADGTASYARIIGVAFSTASANKCQVRMDL